MGRLTLRFAEQVDANEQARVLAALRKLKAKLRVRPLRGNAERWVFDTAPLPTPKPKKPQRYRRISDREWAKRYRTQMWTAIERAAQSIPSFTGDPMAGWHDTVADWNHDPWTWERLTRLQGLVAAVAIARGCSAAVAPFSQTKGVGMPNNPQWESYESDLRELYDVVADFVAGRGGPEQYRAHQSDPRLLMPAFVDPSPEDHAITRRLVQACDLLGIRILDHIIIGGDRHYSFADSGALGSTGASSC